MEIVSQKIAPCLWFDTQAEEAAKWSMAWVRRHDEYEDAQPSSCCGSHQQTDAA